MGSAAEVYVFDHERYVTDVVPEFRAALGRGAYTARLTALQARARRDAWLPLGPVELERDCTYLRPTDFAFEGTPSPRPWHAEWEARACGEEACASRSACPLYAGRPGIAEGFIDLLEAAVVDCCLGLSKFVGRYFNTGKYADVLRAAGIGEDHRCATLLRSLGIRGWVVGYTFAPIDGIHGWLDPAETRALRDELELLDLPRYPATAAALGAIHHESPGYSYEELSLSFVRTIAELATHSDDGILWGNDLWSVSAGPTSD